MSNLVIEIALRLVRIGLAALLGAILYLVLSGPFGAAGGTELGLLCFVAAGVAILLFDRSIL